MMVFWVLSYDYVTMLYDSNDGWYLVPTVDGW